MSSDQIDNSTFALRSGTQTPLREIAGLAAFVSIALMIAAVAGLATSSAVDGWYSSAERTLWNPPNQVFGPIWSALYTLMAFAGWLVWRRPASPERRTALAVYAGQLALNAGWPPVFFLLYEAIGGVGLWVALVWIVVLDFAVLATIVWCWRVSRVGAVLLVPYWTWLLFATALNASLAVMNA